MGRFRPGPLAVVSPGRGTSGPAGPGPRPSGVLELGVMQRKLLTQIRYLCPGCFHNHLRLDHESDLY